MAKKQNKKQSDEESLRITRLHNLLRDQRQQLGLTLDLAAKALGISAPYLSRLEREIPSLTLVQCKNFADVYGISLRKLMELSGHVDIRDQFIPMKAIDFAFECLLKDPCRTGNVPALQTVEAKVFVIIWWQHLSSRSLLTKEEHEALKQWFNVGVVEIPPEPEDAAQGITSAYPRIDMKRISEEGYLEIEKVMKVMPDWTIEPWKRATGIDDLEGSAQLRVNGPTIDDKEVQNTEIQQKSPQFSEIPVEDDAESIIRRFLHSLSDSETQNLLINRFRQS